MNILVTGGTGFIGEFFIPELLKLGHNVRLLVRNIDKAQKMFGKTCEYVIGDICDKDALKNCCDNIDVVYHMVAKVGNEIMSNDVMEEFRKINVVGTKNLVEEAKKSKVKRFIYVSSIAAMGIVKDEIIDEQSKCNPQIPYQISKYECEMMLQEEFKNNLFPVICVRPTKVYGVGEHEYSFLTLSKLCKKGIFIQIGEKNNYVSNIYITDFVKGLISLLDKGNFGEIYILSSKESISFEEIGYIIAHVLKKKIKIIKISSKLLIFLVALQERVLLFLNKKPFLTQKNIEANCVDRIYNISKAEKELKFIPTVTMKKGIENVVNWYLEKDII